MRSKEEIHKDFDKKYGFIHRNGIDSYEMYNKVKEYYYRLEVCQEPV